MKKNKLPVFIIIGVAKSGTTSLYNALLEHPKIKPARTKELYFFNRNSMYKHGKNYYKKQFKQCEEDEICGEATPYYLYFPEVPARIKKYVPDVKLIAMLRNPIDRAYSHFYGYLRLCKMRNQKPIAKTMKDFLIKIKNNPKIKLNHRGTKLLSTGLYGKQIERWLKYFPLEQIMVIKSEDFFKNPKKITKQVFEFIGVKPYEAEAKHYLKTTESNLRTLGVEKYSPLTQEERDILYEYYKDSNQLLYKLIGRDLRWKR